VLDHQRRIGTGELDINLACFQAFGIARAITGGTSLLEAHSAELVQMIEKPGYLLCGLLQVIDGHHKTVSQSGMGREAAAAQKTSPACPLPGFW